MNLRILADRNEAGLLLAEKLSKYKDSGALVLAIPRGGVPVGYAIASQLGLDLDITLSKKIGHPLNPEFAIGSVSSDSVILDEHGDVSSRYIESEIASIKKALDEKYKMYTGNGAGPDIKGRVVIVVDDGIATGNTLLATISMLRKKSPLKIVVASPVVPHDRVEKIREAADEFIYLWAPEFFPGVGIFYEDFGQVSDEEVKEMLNAIKSKKNHDPHAVK